MKKFLALLALAVCSIFFLGHVNAAGLDKAIVAVSVDDGDSTLYSNIYPIMAANGLPFTAYIVPNYVGTAGHVNWDQTFEMNWNGVEIGNHADHSDFTSMTAAKILNKINAAKNAFLVKGFIRVTSFAYPFGVTSTKVTKSLAKAGYTHARGAWDENDKFNIPSTFNPWWIESVSFRNPRKFEDVKIFIDEAIAEKKMLGLVLHVVSPGASGTYELPSEELEKTAAYLKQLQDSGLLDVATVTQAVSKLMYYKNLP